MATALVTGSNRGIGLELCRQLAARGDEVIATCRTTSPELEALGVRIEANVDVADETGVRALAERLDVPRIDLLVLNAGIGQVDLIFDFRVEQVRKQLEVNALGPVMMTALLLDRLAAGSKIAIITSRMGSIADNDAGGMYGYRMSKAAVNAAGRSLALDLAPRGVAVALLHPGFVATAINHFAGSLTPEQSVTGMLARIDALTLETSGSFWDYRGNVLPW